MTTTSFEFTLNCIRQTRHNMERIMQGFTIEQLNTIPEGFRNNLIWNYGHVIVTQQLLCYGLSGQKTFVDKSLIEAYRKGTAPNGDVDQAGFQELQSLSVAALNQFEEDYKKGIFQTFKTYPTSYGVELTGIEEAFNFNLAHEAMHMGTMLAIRKLV
ncbi:MAG: DinB family protein [Bacteroidota bacterium]